MVSYLHKALYRNTTNPSIRLTSSQITGYEFKLTARVEAPDAPIMYIAEVHEKNVRPDFSGTVMNELKNSIGRTFGGR